MTDDDKRVWDHTGYGWASRAPGKQDKERALIMSRWARGEIDYKTVLEELKAKHISVPTHDRDTLRWI